MYKCNALYCCYITYAVVGLLHFSHTLRLAVLIDRFGELMTVAQITSFTLAALFYFFSTPRVRMSGNFIYDYFSAFQAVLRSQARSGSIAEPAHCRHRHQECVELAR